MKKIKIVICCGTTCHVMGSSEILLLKEEFNSQIREKLEIVGDSCLGFCKADNKKRPPFVYVNNQLIEKADLKKVKTEIEKLLKLQKGD